MARAYALYDVFSDQKLAGNQLAIVFDCEGLESEDMQRIAVEFNLSETIFVMPPNNGAHTARVRIFTPGSELPFAGHPTVGAAIALAEQKVGNGSIEMVSVLEEGIGPVRCAVRLREDEVSFAEFDLPRKSEQFDLPTGLDKQGLADALSVSIKHIGFENHVPRVWNAGVPFLMVPVKDISTLGDIEFDGALWERVSPLVSGVLAPAYVYCRGKTEASFQARMFWPANGVVEDPATGSAAAALSGTIHHFDRLVDGYHALTIRQGVEMGRPSLINLHLDIEGGEIARARVGGNAVKVAAGFLEL
jgi:trans-2,3-dihydro-3-hydroxyanthranilate isomerase